MTVSTDIGRKYGKGYTKVPHSVFEWLLLSDLSKRELKVVLLIIRLSFGCHTDYVKLRQAELLTVGITAGHAKAILDSLIAKKIIFRKGRNLYRLDEVKLQYDSKRTHRLSRLVGKHTPSYQKSNAIVTEKVTPGLPEQQDNSSQTGNTDRLPKKELLRLSELNAQDAKDTDIYRSIDKENKEVGGDV